MSEMINTEDQCQHIINLRRAERVRVDVQWGVAFGFVDPEVLTEARKWRALQRAGLVNP